MVDGAFQGAPYGVVVTDDCAVGNGGADHRHQRARAFLRIVKFDNELVLIKKRYAAPYKNQQSEGVQRINAADQRLRQQTKQKVCNHLAQRCRCRTVKIPVGSVFPAIGFNEIAVDTETDGT